MNRYINLDRLIFCLEDEWFWHSKKSERGLRTAMRIVEEQPIVDAVEVVRCKDCKHHDDCICVVCEEENTVVCKKMSMHFPKEHFCSYGERRE